MNTFENKIFGMRRSYIKAPILVQIFRKGLMFYTVQVSKGPTCLSFGEDHSLTTLMKARKKAEELVENFITKNSNFKVIWKEPSVAESG